MSAPPDPARVRRLNDRPEPSRARYVLYWMQQAQRAECNPALEFAVREARARRLPVVVGFGLTDAFPEANLRHYTFLLEGLAETRAALARRGIAFVLRRGAPDEVALALSRDAAFVVADRGYLRVQREWRDRAAQTLSVPLIRIEGEAVVPVNTASDHAEFAARTLRPKIQRLLEAHLQATRPEPPPPSADGLDLEGETWSQPGDLLARLRLDRSVGPAPALRGGTSEARRRLRRFVEHLLPDYAELRNDPSLDRGSQMSAYLHFGQISPLEIARAVLDSPAPRAAQDAFLEELIVRRELSLNYCEFQPAYDRFEALPAWARKTLAAHAADRRDYTYSPADWDAARTHDPYWNAAQREMVLTGRMHNYLRMYWGKKILEWSATPEEAFRTALHLNNRYALDGRDPNSFAGVAWCFGLHDRPWLERPVFGQVRYMNAAGLDRKFDMPSYLARVNALEPSAP